MDAMERVAVVVEDDADIRFLLETTLRQAGFEVHSAATGEAGVAGVRAHDPLVTTLDISLPDIDGFEVARRIRQTSSTYLLMLTGRSDEIDTLLGLEAGADDYVTKPFRPREVRARIEAMLRRPRAVAGSAPSASTPSAGTPSVGSPSVPSAGTPTAGTPSIGSPSAGSPSVGSPAVGGASDGLPAVGEPAAGATTESAGGSAEVLRHRGLVVDLDARDTVLDGAPVNLTRTEFDVLAALLRAGRRVLSKDELVRVAWGEHDDFALTPAESDRRALEVHVANLRRKLGDAASAPRFVETVRGVGYRLAPVRPAG